MVLTIAIRTSSFDYPPPMSSDKKPSDQSNNKSPSSEIDISMLSSLIASTTITTNGDKTGDPGSAEGEELEELGAEEAEKLIRRLDVALGVADDIQGKLNGIISHLDGLLNSLEEKNENGGPADPQPDR